MKAPFRVPSDRKQLVAFWDSTVRPMVGKNGSRLEVMSWFERYCGCDHDTAMILTDALAELLSRRNAT